MALTPHWGSRALLLGATGRGVARYDFPPWLASRLPAGMRFDTPPSEGVLLFASGGMTHNLASVDLDAPPSSPPAWSKEFDTWAAERLVAHDVDALVDWRRKAPASDLAHPDDGAHFRVLLVALGAAAARAPSVRFPSVGFDLGLSMRSVEMA